MKAILEFNLPEEEHEHRCAVAGQNLYGDVYEIDQWLRGLLKHGGIDKMKADELGEQVRERLNDTMMKVGME